MEERLRGWYCPSPVPGWPLHHHIPFTPCARLLLQLVRYGPLDEFLLAHDCPVPKRKTAVVFLESREHPSAPGDISPSEA